MNMTENIGFLNKYQLITFLPPPVFLTSPNGRTKQVENDKRAKTMIPSIRRAQRYPILLIAAIDTLAMTRPPTPEPAKVIPTAKPLLFENHC